MPGGIGPMPKGFATRLRCRERSTGLPVNASHAQIFFNLGLGRVHYLPEDRLLYFVDSEEVSISETICAVFKGLGKTPQIEQLFLDNHGLIKGASRLSLSDYEAQALMAALRLKGFLISMAGSEQ